MYNSVPHCKENYLSRRRMVGCTSSCDEIRFNVLSNHMILMQMYVMQSSMMICTHCVSWSKRMISITCTTHMRLDRYTLLSHRAHTCFPLHNERIIRGTLLTRSKNRITLTVCANASGTSKIPLIFVEKIKKPMMLYGFPWSGEVLFPVKERLDGLTHAPKRSFFGTRTNEKVHWSMGTDYRYFEWSWRVTCSSGRSFLVPSLSHHICLCHSGSFLLL